MFVLRRVQGMSMLPALRPGQIVLARKRLARISPGDIIIIRHDGLEKIKRVQRVSPGRVFVVGDNAAYSTDSREFGWLENEAVVGKVCWPVRRPAVKIA